MKISECDIDCYLVCWYGIDINGYVFYGYSTGTSYVPEFVVIEEYVKKIHPLFLKNFFDTLDTLNLENRKYINELNNGIVSDEIREIFKNYLPESNYIELALKGITPFEILDGLTPLQDGEFKKHPYHYRKVIEPTSILNTKLLHFNQLPENIQKIMNSHRVDIDVQKNDYFYIPSVFNSPLFEQE